MVWLITQRSRSGLLDIFYCYGLPSGRWWTYKLAEASMFYDRDSASKILKKLKYNNPRIISLEEAEKLVAARPPFQYNPALKKNNYDRQVPPVRRSPAVPRGDRVQRNTQLSMFDDETERGFDQLYDLNGW